MKAIPILIRYVCPTFHQGIEPWNVSVGQFYSVQYEMDQDKRICYYVAKIIGTQSQGTEVEVEAMCQKQKDPPTFVFPNVPDKTSIQMNDLMTLLILRSSRRGTFIFEMLTYNCM